MPSEANIAILEKTFSYERSLATFSILIRDALNENQNIVKHPVVIEARPRVMFQRTRSDFIVYMEDYYWNRPISLAHVYFLKLQFDKQSVAIFFITMLMLQLTSALKKYEHYISKKNPKCYSLGLLFWLLLLHVVVTEVAVLGQQNSKMDQIVLLGRGWEDMWVMAILHLYCWWQLWSSWFINLKLELELILMNLRRLLYAKRYH